MRCAIAIVAVLALAGCEDTRRAHHRSDDDGLGYTGDDRRWGPPRAMQDKLVQQLDDLQAQTAQIAQAQALPATGAWECDELIRLTLCTYDQSGMAGTARQALLDGVGAWREALNNTATRQATIDACKMSLDAAKSGFDAAGCR